MKEFVYETVKKKGSKSVNIKSEMIAGFSAASQINTILFKMFIYSPNALSYESA